MTNRGSTLTLETQLVVEDCVHCHILYAVPKDFEAARRRDKITFYCPNGHPQSYQGESDDAKIKRLQREKDELEATRARQVKMRDEWIDEERQQHKATKQQLTTTKGQLTKTRNRAAHGVCPAPDCGRTFRQLGPHMRAKHPDYVAEADAARAAH